MDLGSLKSPAGATKKGSALGVVMLPVMAEHPAKVIRDKRLALVER